jgi:CDP-diacylglycerol pyrophosphatase
MEQSLWLRLASPPAPGRRLRLLVPSCDVSLVLGAKNGTLTDPDFLHIQIFCIAKSSEALKKVAKMPETTREFCF